MGAISGGVDMITGKTVGGINSTQPYDEWLSEMLILHGDGLIATKVEQWSKLQAAISIGHVTEEGHDNEFNITDKGKRYLTIIDSM
jgi:hypothetical protein